MLKQIKKVGIIPLRDRVVIEPTPAESKTASGIIIPDTASQEKPEQGVVVAVGEGRVLDNGSVQKLAVSVGDTVMFSKYATDEISLEGKKYLVVREESILGIIDHV